MAIESACKKLDHHDTDQLRAHINGVLRKPHAPKPNHTKGEINALVELKKDNNRTIFNKQIREWQWWSRIERII